MPRIRATHTPDGLPVTGGPPPARYATQPPWPGITTGHDAHCQCTWAWRHGRMELKYVNTLCPNRTGAHRS